MDWHCKKCYIDNVMITNYIYIGNNITLFNIFDIVVDLNYPSNNTKLGNIDLIINKNKIIITAGTILNDTI